MLRGVERPSDRSKPLHVQTLEHLEVLAPFSREFLKSLLRQLESLLDPMRKLVHIHDFAFIKRLRGA